MHLADDVNRLTADWKHWQENGACPTCEMANARIRTLTAERDRLRAETRAWLDAEDVWFQVANARPYDPNAAAQAAEVKRKARDRVREVLAQPSDAERDPICPMCRTRVGPNAAHAPIRGGRTYHRQCWDNRVPDAERAE